jgi:hypothetical protein
VIRSFRDKDTEAVFRRQFSRKFHPIARVAKRKLDQSTLRRLPTCEPFQEIIWRLSAETAVANTAFELTINGGSAFVGRNRMQ